MRRTFILFFLTLSLGTMLIPRVKRWMRHILRELALLILHIRSHPFVLQSEPVLVIAPHPDDDVLGCGGYLFHKRLAGQPVHVIYVTDGSASHPQHPLLKPAELATLRRAEALKAASLLGLDSACLYFLDLPDGRLPHLSIKERDNAIGRIAVILNHVKPVKLLLPFRGDGSSEHEAAFKLVLDAVKRAGIKPRLLEFPVWSLWQPLLLFKASGRAWRVHRFPFPGCSSLKERAIAAHVTQLQPTKPWKNPVLPADFLESFSHETEYFFEMK